MILTWPSARPAEVRLQFSDARFIAEAVGRDGFARPCRIRYGHIDHAAAGRGERRDRGWRLHPDPGGRSGSEPDLGGTGEVGPVDPHRGPSLKRSAVGFNVFDARQRADGEVVCEAGGDGRDAAQVADGDRHVRVCIFPFLAVAELSISVGTPGSDGAVAEKGRLWKPPAETAVTPVRPLTAVGTSLPAELLVPLPSCPSSFSPQAMTVPALSRARVSSSPAETAVTPLRPRPGPARRCWFRVPSGRRRPAQNH